MHCMFVRFEPMLLFFYFNDTPTTEIYTLSLHDALPISSATRPKPAPPWRGSSIRSSRRRPTTSNTGRSEEHTSELQSHVNLVCRLLLEKKNQRCLLNSLVSRKCHWTLSA